jgi:hypothetical protein
MVMASVTGGSPWGLHRRLYFIQDPHGDLPSGTPWYNDSEALLGVCNGFWTLYTSRKVTCHRMLSCFENMAHIFGRLVHLCGNEGLLGVCNEVEFLAFEFLAFEFLAFEFLAFEFLALCTDFKVTCHRMRSCLQNKAHISGKLVHLWSDEGLLGVCNAFCWAQTQWVWRSRLGGKNLCYFPHGDCDACYHRCRRLHWRSNLRRSEEAVEELAEESAEDAELVLGFEHNKPRCFSRMRYNAWYRQCRR